MSRHQDYSDDDDDVPSEDESDSKKHDRKNGARLSPVAGPVSPGPPQLHIQGTTDHSAPLRNPDNSTPGSPAPGSEDPEHSSKKTKKNVRKTAAWRDLPRKDQLLVLTLARLSEPLVQTSLQSYMFYQLKWFDPSLPDSTISTQAGALQASFTGAQFLTALLWGRLADSSRLGRKTVLLIGLGGACVSCLGFGFSTSFVQALLFRILGGITNGNVGVMRTMISEIVREKRFQSRAFLLLPMTFNIGVIVGPVLGGVLSDPAGSYPERFGNVDFFKKFPYATPNILSVILLSTAFLAIFFCLEETLDSLRDRGPDLGLRIGRGLGSWTCSAINVFRRGRNKEGYQPLHNTQNSYGHSRFSSSATVDDMPGDLELDNDVTSPTTPRSSKLSNRPRYTRRLAFRKIFTRNVLFTFASHFLLAFHLGTFNALWFVFLSTPQYDPATAPSHHAPRLPFHFTGGLGMPPDQVGLAMAILGVLGLTMQFALYPKLSARLGTLLSFRLFVLAFPLTYFLAPYLAVVPSSSAASSTVSSSSGSSPQTSANPKTGPLIWLCIGFVLFFQVSGRTFALPGQTILVNNCTPHPSVLGTVHGLAQSASSAARTVGPMLGGWMYGRGLAAGVVGAVWWALAGVALLGIVASWFVREGDGHEIWLEGDLDEEETVLSGNNNHAEPDRSSVEGANDTLRRDLVYRDFDGDEEERRQGPLRQPT